MSAYNRYIVMLAAVILLIDVMLAFWGQNDLVVYFIANIIAYLILTTLYVYINPGARRALNTIAMVLFGGFMVIIALKVVSILGFR